MVNSSERKILSFYKSKKILVSGATGYIAWNLINKLLGIDCEITCLTRKPPSELYMENFTTCNAEVNTIVGSYDDEALWKKSLDGVDIVFHLASQTSFYRAEEDPLEDVSKAGELMAYKHEGFWQCMDTKRDKDLLEEFSKQKVPPWNNR